MHFLLPSEFFQPNKVQNPVYKLSVIETSNIEVSIHPKEIYVSIFNTPVIFDIICELYVMYSAFGGFSFSTESIALRMKSMDRVLCWIGISDDLKFTCTVERCHDVIRYSLLL